MEEIAALIPGAQYRLIPDTGHMVPVEQPEALTAVLAEFLEKHVRA
jgi:pimeloyl-ACP methyl ester carboxylesterase